MSESYRVLVLLLVLSASGCAQITKVKQCRRVAELVNAERATLHKLQAQKTPAAYRSAAASYKKLAGAVRNIGFVEFSGKAVSEEYATTLEALVTTVSAYAEAMEQGAQREQDAARRAIERHGRDERAAAQRLEGYCRPR